MHVYRVIVVIVYGSRNLNESAVLVVTRSISVRLFSSGECVRQHCVYINQPDTGNTMWNTHLYGLVNGKIEQ